jgi:hypothetical protein
MGKDAVYLLVALGTLNPCFCSSHHVDCVQRTSPIVNFVTPMTFCDITLYDPKTTDPSRQARYRVLPSNPDRGTAVCGLKRFNSVDCTVEQGPIPTYCVRGGGCAQLAFLSADANALQSFLGTDTYDMSVNCDGAVGVFHYPVADAAPDSFADPALQIGCYAPVPN